LEAETYLSSGYGLRLAIQERAVGWQPFAKYARVWQPSRLKGIQVGPDFGTPFLAATQVFDIRPFPRKWLSIERTHEANDRFLTPGTIVVTCSGAVGRATLAHAPHEKVLISHDLLRITATDKEQWGWIYAYLRSPQARAMMSGAKYGHMIKHLEVSHLNALPVPVVNDKWAAEFHKQTTAILDLRNRAYLLNAQAEDRFSVAIGRAKPSSEEHGFSVSAVDLLGRRRRLEASHYAPTVSAILNRFSKIKANVEPLSILSERVWWMTRFRRFYGEAGIPYLSADELFTINPAEQKRILVAGDDGHENFFVKRGWLIMACSGQVYGLNGAVGLMTEHHENIFFSHDLIRIVPDRTRVRSGYLLTALTHPELGRPLLMRLAYGTSIPHLDPSDVAQFPVVRLAADEEETIADLAETAVSWRAEADMRELELAATAGELIDKFMAGDMSDFIATVPGKLNT
jgi:hypothetical protein